MKSYLLGCRILAILGLFFSSINLAFSAQEAVTLVIAKPSAPFTQKNEYITTLLEKSFAEVGTKLKFTYTVKPMNNKRIFESLSQNEEVTLAWLNLSESQATQLSSTTYPIYRGLHAKRLLMIKKTRLADFSKIKTLEQLKPLIALQEQSWSDYRVLKNNKLTVNGDLDYNGMLKALDEGLGDYFPRSVTAIEAEINKYSQYDFVIEPNIMLQYPSHYFFYANKKNKHLIDTLQQGLNKLAQKGELNALYEQFYGAVEQGKNLEQRIVFKLKN